MNVVQTFANTPYAADRVSLLQSSKSERQFIKAAMKKQLELVAHAVVRGQNLPGAQDLGFTVDVRTLGKIRAINMANAKKHRKGVSAEEDPSVASSLFEQHFGIVDIGQAILSHLPIKDMKALAGTSKTCRAIVHGKLTSWDLGKLDMGHCNEVDLPDDAYNAPHCDVWVHGRSDFKDRDIKKRFPKERWFDTDGALVAHDTLSFNLIYSASDLSAGRPMRRVDDDERDLNMSHKLLSQLNKMHASAIRKFQKLPDKSKKNLNFIKFTRIHHLLTGFANHGQHFQRLYLDKVSYLDVAVLTVAIENLPQLQQLHIDNCEQLHIGSLISILDVIHWFGARRGNGFIDLDFFPKTWFGPDAKRTATCVVTHNPPFEHHVGMGVMVTIIIASLKAAYMGHEIAPENSLLEKFLLLVPMPFGLMSLFLRELKEYVQLCKKPKNDLTKAEKIRMETLMCQILACTCVPMGDFMTTRNFMPSMARYLMAVCSHCKHKVLANLLHPQYWSLATTVSKKCMACNIAITVEADDHAWLPEKREINVSLFANSNVVPDEFEPPQGKDLICPVIPNDFVRHPAPTFILYPTENEQADDTTTNDNASDEVNAQANLQAYNQFVANPGPTREEIDEINEELLEEFLDDMGHHLALGMCAAEGARNIHLRDDLFWDTTTGPALATLKLDSKDRFAQVLGMFQDDSARGIQPNRAHYIARTAWEGIYRGNVGHQGRPVTEAEQGEWCPPPWAHDRTRIQM